MPIGDLLAEITGERPSPVLPSASTKVTTTTAMKRKADGESNSNGAPNKLVKQSHLPSRNVVATTKPTPPANRPAPMTKPVMSSVAAQRPSANTSASLSRDKPYTGTATPGRPPRKPETLGTSSSQRNGTTSLARPSLGSAAVSASKVAPVKASVTTPTNAVPAKAPKKGSFAEIMARGAKAQQIAPKAGVIQHKAIGETVMSKKEREQQKSKWKSGKITPGDKSSTIPSREKPTGNVRNGAASEPRPTAAANGRPRSAGGEVVEKKLKKAAMASTGYTGTARPSTKKPSETKSVKSASSRGRPGGGLLAPPRVGSRKRDDDEDSDMDDFIDDDDGEDDLAPRGYRYADEYDSDSDMEAGADDIYAEEQRALRQAREDDAREQALLEKLKREKEARKRR